jgi:His/Glu/Gln/Arg/opine family amino acid ABC transporter permease subunit
MNFMQNKARNAIWTIALTIFLSGCASNYGWGWFVVNPSTAQGRNNLDFLIGGLGNTIAVSLCAMFLSVSIGLAIGVMGMTRSKLLRGMSRVYVEAFRSVPILVMLLWVFYGLPVLIGLRLDVFTAAVLALALCDSAFEAEIFRGGIQSIERGQHEAADSIGLTWWQKMRLIILPQAVRRILPPLGNQFVYVTKMSSLASVIGLGELTRQANELVVTLYRPLEIYTILVLEYMGLILLISWGVRWLEARLGADENKGRR